MLDGGLEPGFQMGLQCCYLDHGKQRLRLFLFDAKRFLSLVEPAGEVAHADGHREKDGEHECVLWIRDVQGEAWGDEQEVPDERAEGCESEDGTSVPGESADDDRHQEQQSGEHIAREVPDHRPEHRQHGGYDDGREVFPRCSMGGVHFC